MPPLLVHALSLVLAAALVAVAPPTRAAVAAPVEAVPAAAVVEDAVADTYYRVLLDHTRWAQTQWDADRGRYRSTDFGFAVVLGNAVLLTRGDYDAAAAGIDEATLRAQTLATIRHYAASNRLAGGDEWGTRLFWDTTFQSYFVLAAHLMWEELDEATRENVDAIARGQAEYATALGSGNDPRSGGWTPNGLQGGYRGDTKLEEMGVYAQAIAPGLAWGADDERAGAWGEAFSIWSRNEAGLPAADLANPALVDGVAVSENTAHNIWDTFVGENHGSFGPHYQSELWRTSARNSIHFLLAGQPLPEVLTQQPNGEELWETILATMSDAGEPLMPMVDDREHLYGRDVIPLAFLAQVQGNQDAARAEADLAARLEAYQAYPPAHRIAKFSGEPKYEPEARAEVAISYLLHEWRNAAAGPVVPSTREEMLERASRATDYGAGPGLLAQQSPGAWAGTVTKPGFVKFAWQPQHDDWLFDISGSTRSLLPSTSQTVTGRSATAYTEARDGFEGTASLLTMPSGYAGMTTLPTGSVVYATSGTAAGEGGVLVRNLTMPGVPGLDGDRTYTVAEGSTTMEATDIPEEDAPAPPPGVARLDDVTFDRTTARYVRIQGVTGHPTYGYSLFEVEVRDGSDGSNLALGKTATASSADPSRPVSLVVDGSASTRWSVSREERSRGDSWVTVDLGEESALDRVRLLWEAASASEYRVQTSLDGTTWTDVASRIFPPSGVHRVDDLVFDRAQARYVRMLGTRGNPSFGYSVFELEARDGAGTANLARGATATASSADPSRPASLVTDGSYGTRWAVAQAERGRGDSWVAVDLGAVVDLDRVRLFWETAAGQSYRVQTSLDGTTWTDAASFGPPGVSSTGGWLNVDDRAGFVVRGSANPISVHADAVTLSDGPAAGAAGMVVEGYPGLDAAATAARAARPAVSGAGGLRVSDADGYLSLFNVSGMDAAAEVVLPQDGSEVRLYRGTQVTGNGSTRYDAVVEAATSRVEPARFLLGSRTAPTVPAGVTAEVVDGATLRLTAPAGVAPLTLTVTQAVTGAVQQVTLPTGSTHTATFASSTAYPVPDLALDRRTFPTSPLPAGMSDPDAAVDGDPSTAWTPGPTGRMVVDLGEVRAVGEMRVELTGGEPLVGTVEVSSDGVTYQPVGSLSQQGRTATLQLDAETRYVSLAFSGWTPDAARVESVSLGAR